MDMAVAAPRGPAGAAAHRESNNHEPSTYNPTERRVGGAAKQGANGERNNQEPSTYNPTERRVGGADLRGIWRRYRSHSPSTGGLRCSVQAERQRRRLREDVHRGR